MKSTSPTPSRPPKPCQGLGGLGSRFIAPVLLDFMPTWSSISVYLPALGSISASISLPERVVVPTRLLYHLLKNHDDKKKLKPSLFKSSVSCRLGGLGLVSAGMVLSRFTIPAYFGSILCLH